MKGLNQSPENGNGTGGIGPESGSATFNIKVSHGLNQHEVAVPANSSFGDLKSVVVQKIGLKPETCKLLFRGKEKEDDEDLRTAGVKDNAKVLLMEQSACSQKIPEEVKKTNVISKGFAAVAQVTEEVDKLAEQVSALQAVVESGTKVDEKNFIFLTEMLMRQLLKLDSIEAEGEGRVQRKLEVRRVQSFVETVDILKSKNSNPFTNSNNAVSVTTQWETFDPASENTNTPSTFPSTAPAPIPPPTSNPTPVPVPAAAAAAAASITPPPTSSSTPAPTPPPTSTSTPAPTHVPSLSHSTHVPLAATESYPTPAAVPAAAIIPPPTSTPAPAHVPSISPSTHIPLAATGSYPTTTPAPTPTPTPTPAPSSVPSLARSSTKITQEWERFD